MTNTKFRRRALISSLAMLLVALVALGSATFAWFTENPIVTAAGITGQAQTSTGLEIKTTTDDDYSSSAHFMNDGTADKFKFIPAYAINTGDATNGYNLNWLTTEAGSASLSDPKTGAVWTDASVWTPTDGTAITDSNSGVYHEQCFIKTKNSTETATINLTGITIEGKGSLDIRNGVTVLVAVNNKIKAVKKLGTTAILNYSNASSASGSNTVGSSSGNYPNMFTGTAVELGTCTATPLTVDVYVYLDGTDTNVKTDNAIAGALINNISLSFTKATTV